MNTEVRMNNKKLLLVVDMQNDFIDGSLGTPEAFAVDAAVMIAGLILADRIGKAVRRERA